VQHIDIAARTRALDVAETLWDGADHRVLALTLAVGKRALPL